MDAFTMLHGTQHTAENHRIGVIASGVDEAGRGRARLGVRNGDTVDRFTIYQGETLKLSDGWNIRLIAVTCMESNEGKATLEMELIAPGEVPEQ